MSRNVLGSVTPFDPRARVAPALAERTDGLMLALGALDLALALVEFPIFVADRAGAVVHANLAGRRLLEREDAIVKTSVANMVVSGIVPAPWELEVLPSAGGPPPSGQLIGYMAMLRSPPPKPTHDAVSAAALRWKLTARQMDVLKLIALGFTNAEISKALGIRVCTVECHVSAIFDKAGVDNRTTLIGRLLGF